MSFPFYIYFLSFPSPSFSSEHTKPEALWNLHPWLILGMGFWPKNTSSNLGLYWSSSLSFSLCVSHSLLTYPHSLLFSFSSHSVCLHDFSMFLGFVTTHLSTLFLVIFGIFGNLRSTKWSLKLFKGEDFVVNYNTKVNKVLSNQTLQCINIGLHKPNNVQNYYHYISWTG